MASFVELPDGTLINLDNVIRIHPEWGSNRVDYVNGFHHTLNDENAEVMREYALSRNKTTRRKKETTT